MILLDILDKHIVRIDKFTCSVKQGAS